MSLLDIVLALAAAGAAAAAAIAALAYGRLGKQLEANRSLLQAALDVAGVSRLEDVAEALVEAGQRRSTIAALRPAVEELTERHHRVIGAIRTRDQAGVAAQQALETAMTEQRAAGSAVADLTTGLGEAGAAVEETVASISMVSGNINGLADNVSDVSSAIGELAVSVNQVAGSARDASTLSLEADRKAKDGGIAVERLVRSTREVADDIAAVVEKMHELGAASERIGAIVAVIDGIADQTNLLALNAAIEAARAGEHGRGFAVVADEVRKLAEGSAQSTREIGNLIKDIQAKTGEVVRSTSASGTKAENGLQMADVAGRAIGDISSAVSEANRLIEQISMAAREQATGASAIVNSVEQMNNLMREAARSLDEQNASNQQIVTIIAGIVRHAGAVEGAIERQRTACDHLLQSATSLSGASRATRDAAAALDGLGEALQQRLDGVASHGSDVDAAVRVETLVAHAG